MEKKDFKDIGVPEDRWYDEAVRSRMGWRAFCRDSIERCRECQGASSTHCSDSQGRGMQGVLQEIQKSDKAGHQWRSQSYGTGRAPLRLCKTLTTPTNYYHYQVIKALKL